MSNEEKILEILFQMQTDISDLKQGQKSLETKVDKLESKVDKLQDDMSEVKANVRLLWDESVRHDKIIDRIAK